MNKPRFSIVIPTRQRHQTLGYAIQTVLFQHFGDFELIVQDNCSSPETWEVVRQFPTPKLKYQRAPHTLPMNRNWEQALELCEGEYVHFMGDDDGLMPDGLSLAHDILQRVPLEVLSWQKYTYWWESALEPSLRGRLFLHLGTGFQTINPRALLEAFYDWKIGFGVLPSIYTGLVRRDVIERVRRRTGGAYFAYGAPDVWTGIANTLEATQIGVFERGLSVSGNSGASTGCAYFFRSKGATRREDYLAEEGKSLEEMTHPDLVPSVNLEINHADHQLRARQMLFPGDERLKVDMQAVVAAMAANLNRDPDSYEETLEDIRRMCELHGVDVASLPIPPRAAHVQPPAQGPMFGPQQKVEGLAIDCRLAGVHDVHQAARMASAVLPCLTIQ